MSNYFKIKNFDIANGTGIGVSIFLCGCPLHCKGCFNQELWDPNVGKPFTKDVLESLLNLLANPHIDHLSILGGDPMAPYNQATTLQIAQEFKKRFPNKKLWIWTGYTKEFLEESCPETFKQLWEYIDVMVDGPFIEELKEIGKGFKGSKNQRIIYKNT